MTKIIVSIMPINQKAASELKAENYVGADIIEWRADFMPLDQVLKAAPTIFQTFKDFPILFTLRTVREGGLAQIPDEIYAYILGRIANEQQPAFLDIEFFSFPKIINELSAYKDRMVLSFHDNKGLPTDLPQKMAEMVAHKSALIKVAVSPKTEAEVLEFMQYSRAFADSYAVPLVSIAMGKIGQATRVLSALTGSIWTFASVGNQPSAPGQLTLKNTRQLLELLGETSQ